jgi:hypothetical protein
MKPSDKIWLEPECDECDERCWSCAPFDDCENCGKETIGYVRDDIVLASTAEASRMFDRIEKLEAALQRANANVEEYERKFYLGTDRIEKLEVALRAIGGLDIPRPVAIPYRDDGKPSKHDRCPHGGWMYDECAHCVADYAKKALGAHD